MAARHSDGISSVTAHGEKSNAKEDEVNDVPTLVPLTEEKKENERKAVFFEAPPSLSSHISISSGEESPVEIVDSTEVTKELVETKYDVSRRKPAISSHFSTSPSKETPEKNGDHTEEIELVVSSKVMSERILEPSKDTDLVVRSKAVQERSLEPSKNMEPAISSKKVSGRNRDYTKNPELVVQKKDVSKIKTTSKAVLANTLWSSANYPSKYKIILCDVDSPAKVTRAEAITKAHKLYYERNDILKMRLRKGPASRTEIKDTLTRQTGIRESFKDTLSEVDLQTIADIVLEKVDAATQTDEDFCSAKFRQLEEFGETVETDMNTNRPTAAAAAAATSIMVPLRTRSSAKSRTIVDFNNLSFVYGKRDWRYFAALERSIALSKTPIKWEDVKISWQPTPSCYAPSIASLEKDDSISKPFSELYDEVDQVMDSLRLWELKYSGSSKGQPGFNTDILRQELDLPSPLTRSITLKDENPTIKESLNVQTLQHKISSESESSEKSLELFPQSYKEASADDNTELCWIYQPGSSNSEEAAQAFNFSFPQFIFPSVPIDTNVEQCNPRIEEIDDDISSESVASSHISEEARISSHPTLSSGDFQEEEKPPLLTPIHCSIQGASAVNTHSNKPYSRVDPNSEGVVHSGSFEPNEITKGSADDF
ncbi:Hypothetical predicted protein [Octopus vulgaris]|uniref:Uncharacterized protein n=1 Tax=Octopus vulgaris TaxID=6645 RepID=A0AA36BL34_OCTVU|nr:Hypothetical predicted protein [Octopus vulgaris]